MTLTDKKTLVVFTTAPTGLGHLRVMDSLKEALPRGVQSTEVGLKNLTANKIHALGSRIPILTKITEFYQTNPLAENLVSKIYIAFLRFKTNSTLKYFEQLASKYPTKKIWVVVSTHFSLAHTLAVLRPRLEKKFKIKVLLTVIVTDDSPQRVWAVNGADLIFAPSEKTANTLKKFAKDPKIIRIVSFPISPKLIKMLPEKILFQIQEQLDPLKNKPTHIQIPISGAAVQIPFIQALTKILSQKQYTFTIIGQKTIYSYQFLYDSSKLAHTQVSIGTTAKETVDYYESVFFQNNKASVEITKPSEQMFKALLSPNQYGGVLLLLTDPVGRQEHDNLLFLQRHKLIPDKTDQDSLLKVSQGFMPTAIDLALLRYKASHWRALKLPLEANLAADFIVKMKEFGILSAMLSYISQDLSELKSDGSFTIWDEISKSLAVL